MPGVRQQNTPANTVRYRTDTLSSVLPQVQERVIDQCKTANGIGYQRARRFNAEPITQYQILFLSDFSCLYRLIICPAAYKKKPPWADHSLCSKAGHGGIREVSPCPFPFSIRLICQKSPSALWGQAGSGCEIWQYLNKFVISCAYVSPCHTGAFHFLYFGTTCPKVRPHCRSPPAPFRSPIHKNLNGGT